MILATLMRVAVETDVRGNPPSFLEHGAERRESSSTYLHLVTVMTDLGGSFGWWFTQAIPENARSWLPTSFSLITREAVGLDDATDCKFRWSLGGHSLFLEPSKYSKTGPILCHYQCSKWAGICRYTILLLNFIPVVRRRSWPVGCSDRVFESRWGHWCFSVCLFVCLFVCLLCCPVSVEAFATSRSLV